MPRYNMLCLPCCVRLLQSAGKSRTRQEGMLAVIGRYPKAPSREQIIEALKKSRESNG